MSRPTKAVVNLSAIRHNYQLAKQLTKQPALAVIKADAYGHGATAVAQALHDIADGFAVACIEEAMQLRKVGINQPVLLLEGFFTQDELAVIAEQQFTCVVHNQWQLQVLLAESLSKPINVWLKFDSGMHRLGLLENDYLTAYQQLLHSPNVQQVVCMTHLASADELTDPMTHDQLARFKQLIKPLNASVSVANSAAVLGWPETYLGWVRPGIMLYGASPFVKNQPDSAKSLQAAMTLQSALIAIKMVKKGDTVGYGATYQAPEAMRMGVVAIGYGDGYPRHAKSGTPLLVNGVRCPLIGRVSMDMLAVDLRPVANAQLNDPVVLWGGDLPAHEVAEWADTIAYELFTGITRRIKVEYTHHK
ncbi:alanine racemase [Spartinivicinus poritis]|uniref:Alanine racemase n=1 Tax=Spartinivicinus poritis TaxID=2994640 RepID=A0ABT5UB64_9GAMM|nr:alanine racemase [Spartinivicinus sp. A2-2]MDE1463612.1 alanine racemase [Spartinivicinus sp. A2-2]